LARCPGQESLRSLDSVIVPCPDCGRLVEFFTDEPKRQCRCGRVLLREALPHCAEWCLAAAECLGQAIDLRELEQRVAKVKNDPGPSSAWKTFANACRKKRTPMNPQTGLPEWTGIPPRQEHLRTAQQKAVASLHGQTEAQLRWLGADGSGPAWRLPVLDGLFVADPATGEVSREDGGKVHPTWQILALHYLAVRTRPAAQPPTVTFASLASGKPTPASMRIGSIAVCAQSSASNGVSCTPQRRRSRAGRSKAVIWLSKSMFFPAFQSVSSGMPAIRN